MNTVEEFLRSHQIQYILHEHPAVYTCEEAERVCSSVPGLACKNLFLKGKRSGQYYLVILPATKKADLKIISELTCESKLTFATKEDLHEKLGLEAGAVSPFGLLNDQAGEVLVYIDREVYLADLVSFHPNRNTASLELTGEMFRKFLQVVGNRVEVME